MQHLLQHIRIKIRNIDFIFKRFQQFMLKHCCKHGRTTSQNAFVSLQIITFNLKYIFYFSHRDFLIIRGDNCTVRKMNLLEQNGNILFRFNLGGNNDFRHIFAVNLLDILTKLHIIESSKFTISLKL